MEHKEIAAANVAWLGKYSQAKNTQKKTAGISTEAGAQLHMAWRGAEQMAWAACWKRWRGQQAAREACHMKRVSIS